MPTLTSLRVVLEAETSKLQKGLGRLRDNLFTLRNGIGLVAGAGGLGGLVVKSLEAADTLGKTAENVGVSVRALQELRHAAELSGGSVDQMDSALNTFAKRLGEARQGQGALGTFLRKNNEALLDQLANTNSVKEAIALYADAMAATTSATERNAMSAAAFTKRNQFMIQVLKDGREGLEAFGQSARENVTFVTQEQATAAARARDAMQRLQDSVGSLAQSFALELAPEIAGAVEWLGRELPHIVRAMQTAFSVVGRVIGAGGAMVGALLRGDFSGAAEIGSITIGDIRSEVEAGQETARLQEEGNNVLKDIRDAVREPQPARAG